jgi:peptide/nickel transport system permease protein
MSAAAASTSLEVSLPKSGYVLTWQRLRRDRIALVGGAVIVLVLLACFPGLWLAEHLLHHDADMIFPNGVDVESKPVGLWAHVQTAGSVMAVDHPHQRTTLFVLGGDGPLGRDEFLRLLAGGRTSLEVGLGATGIALVIGTTLGSIAGFYRGWVDVVLSRVTEFAMGFPILFLVVAIGFTISDRLSAITLGGLLVPGALSLIAVIGVFNWFYIARIVRAQVLSLREREFVDAARVSGAGNARIIRKHLLPHLVGPLSVYGSLILAGTIILEAGLSFLNFGIPLPYASWGNMASTNWGTILHPVGADPGWRTTTWTSVWPAVAIFVTVFAFALFAEGVRRALDPEAALR